MIPLAPGLALPEEAVTETFAVIGKRGGGKTNTAGLLAEALIRKGRQTVVVDPVGVWWGLRLQPDGKTPSGLDIPVFGGMQGDLPLERSGGAFLAEAVVEEGISCVLDLSALLDTEWRPFLTAFADRLFHHKAKFPGPMHIILEEAQSYAPQNLSVRSGGDESKLRAAFRRIIQQGRSRGIGGMPITQRPAMLDKNVLEQCETLIVHRMAGTNDIKAVAAWLKYQGEKEEALASLSKLETGEAWVWSPHFLGVMKRVSMPLRSTFDSGATPSHKGRKAVTLAGIDLGKLKGRMAQAVERAKAEDPKELKAKVSALERKVRELEDRKPEAPEPERVEVSVLTAEDQAKLKEIADLLNRQNVYIADLVDAHETDRNHIEKVLIKIAQSPPPPPRKPVPHPAVPTAPRRDAASDSEGAEGLAPRQTALLTVIAQYEKMGLIEPSKAQVAAACGYSFSGGFRTLLSTLHTPGFISYPSDGKVALTDVGRKAAGQVDMLTHEDVMALWRAKLQPRQLKLLEILVAEYPNEVRKDWLAEKCGYEMSGGFRTLLSTLKGPGLIDYPSAGTVRANPLLWPEG